MREINIGNQTVRVRATPLALLYYRQEFGSDLLSDFIKLGVSLKDLLPLVGKADQLDLSVLGSFDFDAVTLLRITWAMAKADAFGKEFPSFEKWLSSFEDINIFDKEFLAAVLEEASTGFFRRAKQ